MNKYTFITNILTLGKVIFILGGCHTIDTKMQSSTMDLQKTTANKQVGDYKTKDCQTIKIIDLTKLCDAQKQDMYLEQIKQWYYDAWSSYCKTRPNIRDWKIPQDELVTGRLPLTLIAYDGAKDDKLVAVVRLKIDNEEDEQGKNIFPEGTYRLSGLYVDDSYRNRGIGRTIVKQALTIAVKDYHASLLGFFSHSKGAQEVYKHCGCRLHDVRKIHNQEAAIYLIENPSLFLEKLDKPQQ